MMSGLDSFTEQAFGILTSSKLADALNIENEPQEVRDRYGYGEDRLQSDGSTRLLTNFLVARRLVEAGARCVSLSFSRWDWHGGNFARAAARLADARSGGVGPDRRPRSSRHARRRLGRRVGRVRPHAEDQRQRRPRPLAASLLRLLAGGGMRTGQVIGSTNRLGEYAVDRPVHFQEVFATLYKSWAWM